MTAATTSLRSMLALAVADYASSRRDQGTPAKRGRSFATRYRISAPTSRSPPGDRDGEFGSVEIHQDGTTTVRVGTASVAGRVTRLRSR